MGVPRWVGINLKVLPGRISRASVGAKGKPRVLWGSRYFDQLPN